MITFQEFNEKHLPQLHQWLQAKHVREFWDDGHRTLEQVKEYYSPLNWVKRYLFFIDNQPAGYIQSYIIDQDSEYYRFTLAEKENCGIDIFMGNEKFLGKGFAIQVITEFVKIYCQGISRIIIDPISRNKKAIHIYEKYGFAKVGELSIEDNKHWIMAFDVI